ncbi:MAG: pilus assembly protein PilM [Phycisphaerales bacterium]
MGKPRVIQQLRSTLKTMNSMRPMGNPLAVDFGVSALRVLKVSSGNPASIESAAQLVTPDDLLDNPAKRILFQFDALPKLIKSGKLSGLRAACVIPTQQMSCKHLQVAPVPGVPIGDIAAGQMCDRLGCEPGALLVRSIEVGPSKQANKQEVICFGASKSFVGRMMDALKRAKLEPVGIHNTFETLRQIIPETKDQSGASLLIDLGSACTVVMIMYQGQMVFARTIEHGAVSFDQAICRQFRCSMMEARSMRERITEIAAVTTGVQQSANPHPSMDDPDINEPIEIMIDEIMMCLRYYKASFPDVPLERAYFVGGMAGHKAISAHLARVLNLETRVVDPMSTLGRAGKVPVSGVDLSKPQPGWATTVGCALCPTDL